MLLDTETQFRHRRKNILAFIPARGGSKRLKNKNVHLLAGKPLLAYTIEAAQGCADIASVVVSTDSGVIRKVAEKYGASCPELRSAELSSDTATVDQVLIQYLVAMEELPESVIVLQPTSPFRTANHIKDALTLYERKKAENVVSLTKIHSPINSIGQMTKELCLDNFLAKKNDSIKSSTESQLYRLNGAIYIVNTATFLHRKTLFFNDSSTFGYEMPMLDSVDIDTDFDLLWAEFVVRYKKNGI